MMAGLQRAIEKRLYLVLFVTFIFRGAFVLNAVRHPERAFATWPDTWEYESVAHNLVQGHGYTLHDTPPYRPEMIVTPSYPFVVAGIYRVFGQYVAPVLVLNLLFSVASVALIFVLGIYLTGNPKVGFWASLLFALNPNAALYTGQVLAETFYLMLSVLLFFIVVVFDRPSPGAIVSFGVVGAILLLTKPIGALPIIGALVYAVWRSRKPKWLLSAFIVLILVFPWLYRNRLRFGMWKFSSVADMTLVIYHAAPVVAHVENLPLDSAAMKYLGPELYEKVADRYPDPIALDLAAKYARKVISSNTGTYLKLMLTGVPIVTFMPMSMAEFARFMGGKVSRQPVSQDVISALSKLNFSKALKLVYDRRLRSLTGIGAAIYIYALFFNLLLLLSAFIGLIRFPDRRFSLVVLLLSLFILVPTGICPSPRYRLQLEPFWSLLAGYSLVSLKKKKEG